MSIMEQQMQDQIEGALTEQNRLLEICFKGNFVNENYIKCPHTSTNCKWKLKNNHSKGYEYLNNTCYLSGSFNLDCPTKNKL